MAEISHFENSVYFVKVHSKYGKSIDKLVVRK